jgi:CRISPR-associated endonuclease/helicase Cas3
MAVAATHDVGKVSPGFQLKYFRQSVRERLPELGAHPLENYATRHAVISEAAVNAHLDSEARGTRLGAVVGAHHGRRDEPGRDDHGVYGGAAWAAERQALLARLEERFGRLVESQELDAHVLAGFVCVADWIGSDERFFPAAGLGPSVDRVALARQAVSECGWQPPRLVADLTFEQVFGFAPRPLQRDFLDAVDGPGLYVLEAPMGSGKTEAALYAAYRLISRGANCGLYFALPTRLTSDKIHERVRAFLSRIAEGEVGVRLAHGDAWLRAFQSGGGELAPGQEWFRPAKRALLMPFAVGTVDQALLSVLKVKHFFVRCFGLAGKVVVLDEVHSYDMYTGSLLDLLVRRLLEMNCTVIVLSATLTRDRRNRLLSEPGNPTSPDAYPCLAYESSRRAGLRSLESPASTEVSVSLRDAAPGEVAAIAVERAGAGQCVLCIANTVAQAQRWYGEVKAAMTEKSFPVGLLHSKFPGWRRAELEASWTAALGPDGPRPAGCVLVATQVVEQSVDLDADFMISELAPSDMLLQRLGRLWRHARPARPCEQPELLIVARNLDEVECYDELLEALGRPNAKVYAAYVLWRTFQTWKGIDRLRLPDDIRRLLERTYSDEAAPAFAEEAREHLSRRAAKLEMLANTARADVVGFPLLEDREDAATRYSDFPMLDAVLARSAAAAGSAASLVLSSGICADVDERRWDPKAAVSLQQNLVSIPCYRLAGAKSQPYLRKYFHAATPVLILGDNGELAVEGLPTGLRYDDEGGLQMGYGPAAVATNRVTYDFPDIDYDEEGFDELKW